MVVDNKSIRDFREELGLGIQFNAWCLPGEQALCGHGKKALPRCYAFLAPGCWGSVCSTFVHYSYLLKWFLTPFISAFVILEYFSTFQAGHMHSSPVGIISQLWGPSRSWGHVFSVTNPFTFRVIQWRMRTTWFCHWKCSVRVRVEDLGSIWLMDPKSKW